MTEFKRRFHKLLPTFLFYLWPAGLSTALTFFFPGIATALQLSLFVMPLISFLIWLPFITVDFVRLRKVLDREKQDMQARFDAEDKALFGENPKSK